MTTAADLVARHRLRPHPEGGHYRETVRLPSPPGERSPMTAILFLLGAGERSHWHRVDAAELWLWHAGAPLRLCREAEPDVLLDADEPQALVPTGAWQAAEAACDGWTLVSCIVAPGFDFAGFELAPDEWPGPEPGP